MEKEIIYSFSEFDQKNDQIWDNIKSFANEWNDSHKSQFIQEDDLEISFPSLENEELQELLEILEKKEAEEEWSWLFFEIDKENDPFLKENIEKHDFIQILGDGYPDTFYLNPVEVLVPYETCKACNTKKAILTDEVIPWKIDNEHSAYKNQKLDVINASHGSLLVSQKFVDALNSLDAKGYLLLPVNQIDDTISKELFQLKSKTAIIKPKNLVDPDSVCSTCGSIKKQNAVTFTIPSKQISDNDFFSRHKEGLWGIYIKKSLYEALVTKNLKSIYPYHGLMVKN